MCTIAAFANAEGGTLLFGVRADGTVVGVTLGANTREQVVNVMLLGYIKQFGMGIERLRQDMRAHGLPEPHKELSLCPKLNLALPTLPRPVFVCRRILPDLIGR